MERKPTTVKRHTRPCKFFQSGACRLSSEECDFAHVVNNPSSFGQSISIVGSCDQGSFSLPHHARTEEWGLKLSSPNSPELSDPYQLKSPTSYVPYPVQIGYPYSTALYSPYQETSPVTTVTAPFHQIPPDQTSIESPITSSTSSFDEPSADEPLYLTSSYDHQLQFSKSMASFSFSYPSLNDPPRPPPKPKSRSRSAGPSKKKLAKFKTKKCKFWTEEGGCPNGPSCTFIHGHEPAGVLPEPDPEHGLPSKPVSVQEINAKRGYYPISWRIIGGGVPLGIDGNPGPESSNETQEPRLDGAYKEGSRTAQPATVTGRRRSNSNPDLFNGSHHVPTFPAETP